MPIAVTRGGTLHTVWSLYRPVAAGAPTELVDPDEFPEGPRFALYDHAAALLPVEGYEEIPYTQRRGLGVFALDLSIPSGDFFAVDTLLPYQLRLTRATANGSACVGRSGSAPTLDFTVLPAPKEEDFSTLKLYSNGDELYKIFGVKPKPADHEILFAQQLLDDWMHRSLWPSVVERERKQLPPDRNLFTLCVRPVIRIFTAQAADPVDAASLVGRYGYGRRDRRVMNQTSGAYLSVMAVLGSPPRFVPIDPAQVEFRPDTGECWIPTGFFLVNYSQVEVTYEAGYRVIPFAAKVALAETIAFVRVKGFGPISQWSIGRVSHATGEELLTPEVKRRLTPYQARFYA